MNKVVFLLSVGITLTEGISIPTTRSTLAQFIADQAQWRGWSAAVFVQPNSDADHALVDYIKTLNLNFIPGQKQKGTERRSAHTAGRVFINNYSPHYQISTPTLIYSSRNNINMSRSNMADSANNSINIDSDILFAYPENCDNLDQCDNLRLEQIFKVTKNLTIRPLGKWTSNVDSLYPLLVPEIRFANKLATIRVGIKNTTALADELDSPNLQTVAEKEEEVHLINLLKCVFAAMNISYDMIEFPKLGWRNDEGTWTHLLGAIADGSVHAAADTVDLSTHGIRNHMVLTNPIIQTISAVYLRNPDGVRLTNVVTGTFSSKLQISVLIIAILLWLSMLAITLVYSNNKTSKSTASRHYEPSEALLWTVGVLCMQGSPWAPKSFSGCVLLLMSLMFAMIIYNSFAAFITSFLSVNDNPFRTIDDLLKTQILFGYVGESQEEHFLRTFEDPSLRVLYYRGLVGDGGVEDVAEGMTRAANSDFAMFATARLARRTLHAHLSSQWRCRIMELPVVSTKTAAAIPLATTSPYNVLINYWLIRIRETGILARIQKSLLPPMPSCIVGKKFHGATLQDLITAFGALLLGMIAALIILFIEIIWAKKIKHSGKNKIGTHRIQVNMELKQQWFQGEYFN